MRDHPVDEGLREFPHTRSRGAKFPEFVHAFRSAIAMQIAPEMKLNCRLPGMEARSPVRVVLDRALRIPGTSKLVEILAVQTDGEILARGDFVTASRDIFTVAIQ